MGSVSDRSFHVWGSLVGKNLYLFSGMRRSSLWISARCIGQSLSAELWAKVDTFLQFAHFGGWFGVGQTLVR